MDATVATRSSLPARFILARFVLGRFLAQVAFVLGFLVVVLLTTQSLRLLAGLGNNELAGSILLLVIVLSIVEFFPVLLPMSVLAALLATYTQMSTRKEWIVLLTAGVSPYRLMGILLAASFGLSFLSLLVQGFGVNLAQRAQNSLLQEAEFSVLQRLFAPGIFHRVGTDATIFIEDIDERGQLTGIFTHIRDDTTTFTVFADSGLVARQNFRPVLRLLDGTMHSAELSTPDAEPVVLQFDTLTWVIPSELINEARDQIRLGRRERERLDTLWAQSKAGDASSKIELFETLTSPWASFIVALGICSVLVTNVWVRRIGVLDLGLAILVGLGSSIAWVFAARIYQSGGASIPVFLGFLTTLLVIFAIWYNIARVRWVAKFGKIRHRLE